MRSLAILSNKGGVGKTSIAVNLAILLANKGKNVCLLDNDFSAPSIMTFFPPKVKWINEYLMGDESLENCLQDITSKLKLKGNLKIGFADPTAESIQNLIQIDAPTNLRMLQNLLRMKKSIERNTDYFIIDCSSGFGFSAVNVMLVADVNLFVVKIINADIVGTSQLISGLYNRLKNRSVVIANQVPADIIHDKSKRKEVQYLIEKQFSQEIGDKVVEFLGWIPTDWALQSIEFEEAVKRLRGEDSFRTIYAINQPEHDFTRIINELAPSMFGE